MTLASQQIAAALDAVAERVGSAYSAFHHVLHGSEYHESDIGWHLEIAYQQLLVLAEALQLPQLRADIARELERARAEGFDKAEADPDGDPYLTWGVPVNRFAVVLQSTFVHEPSRTVTKDLESILRAATYPLNDPVLFAAPPADEADVHNRLEAILRCMFPDLLRKPRLTKPIKHFEPDTGLPSLHTLIEYKFLSSPTQAATIADEILADTRGYHSREWTSFVYVIYETARIRPESEWRQLLRACDIDQRTTVVVLSGESPAPKVPKRTRKAAPSGRRSGGKKASARQ